MGLPITIDELIARGKQLRDAMQRACNGGGPTTTTTTTTTTTPPVVVPLLRTPFFPPSSHPPTLADIAYDRIPSPALLPLLEQDYGDDDEEEEEEEDLIRGLLQHGEIRYHHLQGKFPSLTAAERERVEALERCRFLTITFPSLVLLSLPSLPRRLTLYYHLPPHALPPPALQGGGRDGGGDSSSSGSGGHIIATSFVPIDVRDRKGRVHNSSFIPEGSGGSSSSNTTNPLSVAIGMNDVVLSLWLETVLHMDVVVTKAHLYPDKKTRMQIPGGDNDEVSGRRKGW